MERRFSGSFRIDRPNAMWWRVRNTRSPHQVAWLRHVRNADLGLPREFQVLRLQSQAPGSVVVVLSDDEGDCDGACTLTADRVLLHEPDERLYDALPLERYTPDARRFWQRVFWLVRLPGGGVLLRFVARRRRA